MSKITELFEAQAVLGCEMVTLLEKEFPSQKRLSPKVSIGDIAQWRLEIVTDAISDQIFIYEISYKLRMQEWLQSPMVTFVKTLKAQMGISYYAKFDPLQIDQSLEQNRWLYFLPLRSFQIARLRQIFYDHGFSVDTAHRIAVLMTPR